MSQGPDSQSPDAGHDGPRIDLHAHTTHSDGTMTPTELVELAHKIGLAAIAVTDHDITSGLAEAQACGTALGIEVLNGVEISTSIPTGTVHILAYGFDPDDGGFQALLERVRTDREERNRGIFERLESLKMPLTFDEVARHATGRIIARPHFARAMVERGYADDIRQVFRQWLYDGGPAHAIVAMPTPEEAIEATTAAGGVTVLAHPKQLKLGGKGGFRPTIRRFKEAGLTGIEVQHPTQDKGWRRQFSGLAEEFDLVPSGGSDFHGSCKPYIKLGIGDGSIHVTYDVWEQLRERRLA